MKEKRILEMTENRTKYRSCSPLTGVDRDIALEAIEKALRTNKYNLIEFFVYANINKELYQGGFDIEKCAEKFLNRND